MDDTGGRTGQAQQTWLQRWGSQESPGHTAVALLVFALVLGGMVYIGLSAATRGTDEREGRARDLDGTPREDGTETEDGFLECTEDPRPTLVR